MLIFDSFAERITGNVFFIYSLALQELLKGGRERDVNNKDIVYGVAEECVNTGFALLEEMMPRNSKYY